MYALAANAQQPLTLDSCRTLALHNNKAIHISRAEIDVAEYERKAAFTNYLPKISATGVYLHNGEKTSLLGDSQKRILQNMGSNLQNSITGTLQEAATAFPQFIEPIKVLGAIDITTPLNSLGRSITDALTLDTRNIYIAALSLTQPLFVGGKIAAYNKITRYAEDISCNILDLTIQETILNTDHAYWQVVSLSNKLRLARSFVSLIEKLHSDIEKMKAQGMATEADLLSVSVRQNEAEMACLQAENGLSLARMLLCQLCGLPMDSHSTLADENMENITYRVDDFAEEYTFVPDNRKEIQNLELMSKIQKQQTKIIRSGYLPQLALTANVLTSNPNIINGFSNKFRSTWNIGLELKIPLWNWGEGYYKVKKARAQETIARYTLADAREKIELQVRSARQEYAEARKRLLLAQSNIKKAEENLRNANIAFSEGVATSETVLEAQTAWLQAHSSKIDATIDVILTSVSLQKALGILETD